MEKSTQGHSGAGNAIQQIEERTRIQQLQNKFSSPTFSYGMKSPTPPSPKQTPASPKSEAPGISSVSSHDSNHTTNSVASRRQRIIALSAKNKARFAKSPKNDADKPRSWQSPQSKKAPEPIDTSQNNNDPSSNAMEGYDGKEKSSCVEAPTPPSNKYGISNKIKSFQRENDRASSPPPPPPPVPETQNPESQETDVEPVNRFKAWSEREKKERASGNVNRVVAYPSNPSWKGRVDAPSPVQTQTRRVVVPRSPTASVGSVDSGYQPKPPSSATSKGSVNKQSWNNNSRSYVGTTVGGSPQVNRNFSSPKYGSPQPRISTGSRQSIESYKNMLKPVKKETEAPKSHEKESYGAIIETPQKSSVSSLHAMFDNQKSTPLMPMNSTNSSVRQSLPLRSPSTPTSVKPVAFRYPSSPGRSRTSFNDNDDRSVSSARSVSSVNLNRPVPPVVASWNQKQQTMASEKKEEKSRVGSYYNSSWRMQSPVNHEKTDGAKPSWQQRCKPKPIEIPDSPVNAPKSTTPSQFSIASMMYSQNVNSVQKTMDWPTVTNEKPAPTGSEVADDSLTDIILDSIDDDVPNGLQLPSMLESRPEEAQASQEPVEAMPSKTSSGVKPWENDTKHSVVQSWQSRSSRPKDSGSITLSATESSEQPSEKSEDVPPPPPPSIGGDVAAQAQKVENTVEEVTNDSKSQLEVVPTASSSDSYIEEKKSGDLSFDEDQILGESADGRSSEAKDTEASQHGESTHPRKEPFYDDDSYLSRGDTASRGLAASESMRTSSARSRTIGTYSSEDMSVYVEDEGILSKTEEQVLSTQLEQMNLEAAVGESESKTEEEKEEAKKPELTIDVAPPAKPNLPRLNPSPKDCDQYRSKYFEDSGGVRSRGGRATPTPSVQSKRSTEKQIIDIWATTSQEERDEAISFDETDRWLDCDPDVPADDVSDSSEHEAENRVAPTETQKPDPPEPRPIVIRKPREAYITPEKQRQRAKAMSSNKKEEPVEKPKQDVFDPFGTDAEEEGGLTVEISDDLFDNPDPFMTAESFSPLEWSGSPQKSNTRTNNDNARPQHIGYYNSPDSRFEI